MASGSPSLSLALISLQCCRTASRIGAKGKGKKMHLSDQGLIIILVVGLIAGWLAGKIVKGSGFGLVGDAARHRWRAHRRLASASPWHSFRLRYHRPHHQRHNRSDWAPARPAAHGRQRIGRSLARGQIQIPDGKVTVLLENVRGCLEAHRSNDGQIVMIAFRLMWNPVTGA
jgi:hypothetical protein